MKLAVSTALLSLLLCALAQGAVAGPVEGLGPDVTVQRDAETGRSVTFVGTDPGASVPLAAGAPRAAAREAVDRFAPSFGLRASAEMTVESVDRGDGGRSTVRFQQEIDGLPVIGGELIVNLDESGDLLSIGGELEPGKVDASSSVGEGEAAAEARALVAKKYRLSPDRLLAGPGELSIYDSRILGGPGLGVPRPVWRFEVVDAGKPRTVRELVLVDAELGNIALNFSEIHEAKTRRVCDAEEAEAKVPCTVGAAVRKEGEGATGIADVDTAYDESGGVYDFFKARFNRDSIDGAGLPLISTARFCEEDECPYFNAFWNGEQMTYGPGMITEDIAGHELTHGVTESDSGLFYYYQSGAINESLSDVFGELYDLENGPDPAGDRWKLGEGSAFGEPFRNMKNPPEFGDPDRTGSGNWFFDPESGFFFGDAGGVHSNSGVNNKAAYLLTDGASFNGQTVTGLGIEKVLQIYYEVNSKLLGSASDYEDLGNALRQACANLVGEHGITTGDCSEVNDAVLATEMDEPAFEGAPKVASICGNESDRAPVFFDNLENPGSGNWAVTNAIPVGGEGGFFYPQNSHPFTGFDATYATSGDTNFWGYDFYEESDSRIAMTKSVTVPFAGRMHFNHAFGFESEDEFGLFGGPFKYDGGVIEYSTDGGGSWHDAGGMIAAGITYSGVIFSGSGNELGGRPGFTGESGGYGSTRLDLSSLAGQQVRFRFRIGTDVSVDDYGWFIDDVQIYNCGETPPQSSGPSPPSPPSPLPPLPLPDCSAQQARFVVARNRLRRAARRVRGGRAAVRKARDGNRKAKARRQLRRARKDVKRKRRAVRVTRARLRACLG